MVTSKVLAAVLTASSFFVAEAGKCKPHPHPEYTSLLSLISDTSRVIGSKTETTESLDASYSTDLSSSTGAVDLGSTTLGGSSTITWPQTTTLSASFPDYTASVDPTAISDSEFDSETSTSPSSFGSTLADVTTIEDSTTTRATITISTDKSELSNSLTSASTSNSGVISASIDTTDTATSIIPTTSNKSTAIADAATSAHSTSTELRTSTDSTVSYATTGTVSSGDSRVSTGTSTTDITTSNGPTTTIDATTVTSEAPTSIDATTTLITSLSSSESTSTTESLWTSTTSSASCPVVSVSIEDPSFEGDNTGENRWDYMGQFAGIAVPFQQKSSTSQDVPRAHSGEQFALVSSGPGSTLGSDMWRPISLDSTKKYQVWFSYAPVSDPDQDWDFSFIIATQRYGHVHKETVFVPKGAPFKYVQRTAIFQGAMDDHLYAFIRVNNQAVARYVAIDDIYVGEYKSACAVPTETTSLCGGTQGNFNSNGPNYRSMSMFQGSVEMCARACLEDESCVVFGWVVSQYYKNCYLSSTPKESMGISANDRGAKFYDRSCGQCSQLECLPY
ncbi:uncharacterized protein FRV6_01899 [Fusarium oxysporum]|uniref:Apple domain-containing protein n=1 Tax=Fusarium oxysporum TaxID=5507 RepID=A0A2H3SMM6_FUSOX|nr:uncharacterized protein FRV6_01899 [Fusarium oxysporum]